MITETGKCCLCGGQYERYGNNPWPASNLDGDRCCHKCNDDVVIPMRLLLMAARCQRENEGD